MSVKVEFHLDTRTSNETVTVEMPIDDRAAAADKVKSKLEDTSKSSSAMLKIHDSRTGDYVFVNTMKLANVVVRQEKK